MATDRGSIFCADENLARRQQDTTIEFEQLAIDRQNKCIVQYTRRSMTVTKLISHCARFLFIFATICTFQVATVGAQPTTSKDSPGLSNNETTVWFLDAPTMPKGTTGDVIKGLKEALAAEKGNHILGKMAFNRYIKTRRPTPPECLVGINSCKSAKAMAFDALNIALLIQVKIRQSEGQWEAAYTLVDRRGQASTVKIARGNNAKQLAFSLVGAIYKATGIVVIKSTPSGAQVRINGADVGQTPLKQRLPIGTHQYTLQLKTYKAISGNFIVSPTGEKRVEQKMTQLPGVLILENPPPGAQIVFEGKPPQPANQPVELPTGQYNYELRAPGYQSRKDSVRVEPGAAVARNAGLKKLNPLLRDIDQQALRNNRYALRISYDHSLMWTTFRGARGGNTDLELEMEFRRFTSTDPNEIDTTRVLDPNGVRLEMAYLGENFGITLLSLGYLTDTRTHDVQIEDLKTGRKLDGKFDSVTQLQIKPLQVFYRYFYQNLVPSVELGVGINVQWIDVNVDRYPVPMTFTQTEAFWTFGLGVHYFITPRWFGQVRYNMHDHLNTGVGAQHIISFGIGGALPNLFGVEPEPPNKIKE